MKKSIITSVYFLLFSAGIFAQPTQENVINTFKKNGVTSVKITSTVKEWDSKETKYYWKVSLIKTQPVPPADVDGLTGVTPVSYTHLRAHETVLDLVCRLLLEKKHTTLTS